MTPRPPAGAPSTKQTVIKRYANRRLYNSRTGQYVSRKNLEEMARRGEEFVVEDTTTGEDITHSVLGQIIVAQEAIQKEPLLPNEFMRRLLTFYGDTLRTLLSCYLDFSMLTISNESVRERMAEAGSSALKLVDEQVQQNIRFFEAILSNFQPEPKDARQQGEAFMRSFVKLFFAGAFASAIALAPTARTAVAAEPQSRITILYDAFGKDASMKKDWGFSALVEVAGKRILFDTGNDRDIFAANVKAKGVDLTNLDFVVMSHRHSDHMAGLSYVLSVNPNVKIYAPKEGFGIFGSSLPSSFYRKDASLPPEMRYYEGTPPEVMQLGTAWRGANFELIDKTTEVAPGVTLIALVSDAPGTRELKELSLAVNTTEGILLVVGCSHPGIEKIVEAAATINPKINLIAGGFHLVAAQDDTIAKTVAALKDTFKVEKIAPGHCTGEPTFAALKQAFGGSYIYAGVGTLLALEPNMGGVERRGEAPALDEDDMTTYRKLASHEDPFRIRIRRARTQVATSKAAR